MHWPRRPPSALAHLRYIKEDYLQQNSFTKYDKYCPFYKSVEMMRNIATFHRLATGARRCVRPALGAATLPGDVPREGPSQWLGWRMTRGSGLGDEPGRSLPLPSRGRAEGRP